jgi:hypothetical protein
MKLECFSQVLQSFTFGGGSGALKYKQIGFQKYSLSKHNDVIKMSKMPLAACNVVVGTLYLDMEGEFEGFNETTGDRF